jgi:anti-anti-sigma regulatory factor
MATIEILAAECARHAVVLLDGELDATGSGQVESAVGDVVAAGLEFTDCTALGALRRCRALAHAAGADLLVAGPGGAVVRLQTLTTLVLPGPWWSPCAAGGQRHRVPARFDRRGAAASPARVAAPRRGQRKQRNAAGRDG